MEKLCPVCEQPMIQQTNKKNPKAPDWKCSDRNCKFQFDKQKGTWVVSEYITGAWDNNYEKPEDKIQRAVNHKDERIDYTGSISGSINIVSAKMGQSMGDQWDDEQIKDELFKWHKYFYERYKAPFYVK